MEASARVVFAPWVFDVRGVVYAELGQRITTSTIPPIFSIAPRPTGGTTAPPPALCLDEWRVDVARTTGVTAAGLLELVAALGRGLRRREPRAFGGCEDGHDHRVPRTIGGRPRARPPSRVRGPPAGPCPRSQPPGRRARCDRSARQATPLSIVHRLAARAGPDDYMLAAARTVHARLRTPAGRDALCVRPHHIARGRRLDGAETPRYLNAGTWSTMVRAGRPPASDRLRLVEIEHGDALPPTARLLQ